MPRVLVVDVETTKAPLIMPWMQGAYLVMIGAVSSTGKSYSWLVNHPEKLHSQRQCIMEFQKVIDQHDVLVAHKMQFEFHWLTSVGLNLDNISLFCTLVAEYLLLGQNKSYKLGLNALAERYGIPSKLDEVKWWWSSGYETDEIPARVLIPYCIQDCRITMAIFTKQIEYIKMNRLEPLVALKMKEIPHLCSIEANGLPIDCSYLEKLNESFVNRIKVLQSRARDIIKAPFMVNLSSGSIISSILFGGPISCNIPTTVVSMGKHGEKIVRYSEVKETVHYPGMGLKPSDKIKTKKSGVYKTDAHTLRGLLNELKSQNFGGNQQKLLELLEILLEYSKLEKQSGTYGEGLIDKVNPADGKIHPIMHMDKTRTGRLTSSNPNGQNIPRAGTSPVKCAFRSRFE